MNDERSGNWIGSGAQDEQDVNNREKRKRLQGGRFELPKEFGP
jgi:hypothetical protein